jgi:hypothetical protein
MERHWFDTVADRLYPGQNLKSYNREVSGSPLDKLHIDWHSLLAALAARGMQNGFGNARFSRQPNISHSAKLRDSV